MKYIIILFLISCSTANQNRSISAAEKIGSIKVEKKQRYLVDDLKVCRTAPQEKYNRSEFLGLIANKNNSCLDMSRLVLNREKVKHKSFSMKDASICEIEKGSWVDFFNNGALSIGKGEDETKPLVTFTVPLRTVYYSGGYRWSKEKRSHYFNHVIDREHHLVTSKSNNLKRSRGDGLKSLGSDFKNLCAYAGAWLRIKKKWGMCAFPIEANT